MLGKINVPVAVDSSSKRALTEELAETARNEQFLYKGKPQTMTTLAVISKEMSSLLAVDPKGIVEVLTDLYDSHDEWIYKTSGKGEDKLYNVCVSCFVATTPTWLASNLPQEAIGGGYTSRHVIVSGGERHKLVPWPKTPDSALLRALISDLQQINNLVGPYQIEPLARDVFDSWYKTLPSLMSDTKDERVHPFINRMHVIALKVAMALKASYSNDQIITADDIGRAQDLVMATVESHSQALGGHGRSKYGPDMAIVMKQIKFNKSIGLKKLLAMNWRHLDLTGHREVLEHLQKMGYIAINPPDETGDQIIRWVGKEREEGP
jgi:hypothetical protein